MKRLPDTLEFLEQCGFEFTTDWDNEVTISYPIELAAATIAQKLQEYNGGIVYQLERRARSARAQFVGGPFNGQPHRQGSFNWGKTIGKQISRGRWAAYIVGKDGRAWYQGEAKTQRAAKKLASIKGAEHLPGI